MDHNYLSEETEINEIEAGMAQCIKIFPQMRVNCKDICLRRRK